MLRGVISGSKFQKPPLVFLPVIQGGIVTTGQAKPVFIYTEQNQIFALECFTFCATYLSPDSDLLYAV